MTQPLHHLHQRKYFNRRKTDDLEPFPHPKLEFQLIDWLTLAGGVLGPLMAIPQIYNIFVYHNASGVSLISWVAFTLFAVIWIIYGNIHKEFTVLLSNALWAVMDFIVVIGVLIYG